MTQEITLVDLLEVSNPGHKHIWTDSAWNDLYTNLISIVMYIWQMNRPYLFIPLPVPLPLSPLLFFSNTAD